MPVEGLGVFPHRLQQGIAGLALPAAQGKIHAIRPSAEGAGEGVVPEAGKPEGAGHAGSAGKAVGAVEGIEGEQPGQGIAGQPAPAGGAVQFSYKNHKLCLWANIARALIRKKEPPFAKIEAGNANRTTAKGGSSKWTKKVYHTPAGIANTI